MSSSMSGNLVGRRGTRERGIPKYCICGEPPVMLTSRTTTNPGRLFHVCIFGFQKDCEHLFKWTDESVVEEIEDMKKEFGDFKREAEKDISEMITVMKTVEAHLRILEFEKKEFLEEIRKLKRIFKMCIFRFSDNVCNLRFA